MSASATLRYLRHLPVAKQVLWCYLIWYAVMASLHFDLHPRLWITSLGISAVIGIGLILSVQQATAPKPDRWTIARLFMMPFCVSSFSALVKDQQFVLIFSPSLEENLLALGGCGAFLLLCWMTRHINHANWSR